MRGSERAAPMTQAAGVLAMLASLPGQPAQRVEFDEALSDLLASLARHVATYDCEAHCEPDGCWPTKAADRMAKVILREQA